ncbi:Cytochrome c oxidase subunit 5B [Sparganum proliferum]
MAYVRLKGHFTNISIVSVYAPTSAAEQRDKEAFYSQLQASVDRLPRRNLLIVAGDWNGRTGPGDPTTSHLLGRFGLGSRCENGERLLNFVGRNRLLVTNTCFQHRKKHLLTWYSNDGHTASHIDYILVNSRFRSWVHDSRSMRGAETGNDHRSEHVLVRTRLKVRLSSAPKTPHSGRLDVAKIRQANTAEALSREIRNCYTTRADGEVSNQWSSLKTSVYGAAKKILGYTQRRRSDWISGRTLQLSAQTARARSRNDDCFNQLRKMTAKSARYDGKQYWAEIATSMEQASNADNTRKLYLLICQVSGKPSTVSDSVRDVNGGFIADNSAKVERWRVLVPILKKGDKTRCENYRGISLIDVAAKIFAIVLFRRYQAVYDSKTRPNQTGFRAGRGCANQILTLTCILEFRHSYQQPTAVCFIDFAAAFDSVHRESLWRIMALDGVPAKIIVMIKAYYRSTIARVLVRNNLSQPFGIRSGVRQRCILSSILSNYAIDWILGRALRESGVVEFAPAHRLTDLDYADDVTAERDFLSTHCSDRSRTCGYCYSLPVVSAASAYSGRLQCVPRSLTINKLSFLRLGNSKVSYRDVKTREAGPSSKERPNLIPFDEERRILGCICQEDNHHVSYLLLYKGIPTRCGCGHWFKLVDFNEYEAARERYWNSVKNEPENAKLLKDLEEAEQELQHLLEESKTMTKKSAGATEMMDKLLTQWTKYKTTYGQIRRKIDMACVSDIR